MARLVLCLVLALVSAGPWWQVIVHAAAPGIIETNTKLSTTSNETITLTVAPGNAVGVIYVYVTNGTRVASSVSGDNGDTLASQGHFNCGTARCVDLWMDFSSAGGSATYTLDQSATHSPYAIVAFEVDCSAGTCSLDSAGTDGVTTATTFNHVMAPSGELDLNTDTTWVGACAGDASFGNRTGTASYETDLTNFASGEGLKAMWQWEDDVSSGFTDAQGAWTSDGTMRSSWCRAWGLKLTGAAASNRGRNLLRGVGR